MNFDTLSDLFNRSWKLTFSKEKLFLSFLVLTLCGFLIIFSRALGFNAGEWVKLSLTFLPVFLCGGILLSLGILLIRVYHDEIKKKPLHYKETILKSWDVLIGATYYSLPLILAYLVLWVCLGLFVLLQEIPLLGIFFSTIFAFVPFLIILGTLILSLITLFLLFFIAPIIALKGTERKVVFQTTLSRLGQDLFTNLILILIALTPLLLIALLLTFATSLTGPFCTNCTTPTQTVLEWFFIMIPFTAFLTPAVVFFFNFAAECHVLMLRTLKKKS